MDLRERLSKAIGKQATEQDLAIHIVDSLCAQDQIREIARREGNVEMLLNSVKATKKLKGQAHEVGLKREKYPSLYKRY